MKHQTLQVSEQTHLYGASGLPLASNLSIHSLSSSFSNVTNSYKFYWFLAILTEIQNNQSPTLALQELAARMLSLVWYPVNTFRLSFGKQDRLSSVVASINTLENLPGHANSLDVFDACVRVLQSNDCSLRNLQKEIASIIRYVPFRFLRPWFSSELRGAKDSMVHPKIVQLSQEAFYAEDVEKPLYRFAEDQTSIEIHPTWFAYLVQHLRILRDYCLWNLVSYLQKRNPNVPGVVNKLFAPQSRDLKRARDFWEVVRKHSNSNLTCIYSQATLSSKSYSLDHFLPWSFVAHDQLWNLTPTTASVNSSKSDKLPCIDTYFDNYCQQQFEAIQVVGVKGSQRLLEDYLILLQEPSISSALSMELGDFSDALRKTIMPQLQIAENMGFTGSWTYLSRLA